MPRAIAVAVLVVVTALVYTIAIDYSPAHLGWDELFFGLNAHSIATTGRDIHGRFLPLYFQMSGNIWYQPMIVYATAALFRIAPVNEITLRLPTAIVGVIDVAL